MNIQSLTSAASGGPTPKAQTPEEAARQFEAVLTRQFVEVMTKDLFDEDNENMMTGQADLQRDTLTDALTDHLVDNGTLGLADLLMKQWDRTGRIAPEAPSAPRASGESRLSGPDETPASRMPTMTMQEALRRYAPTERSAKTLDPPSTP